MPAANMGSIYVRLDKGDFTPGDQVTGMVMLNLFSNFNHGSVYLTVAGVEQVNLVELVTTGTGDDRKEEKKFHNDRNFFFNNRFPLHHFAGGFVPAGQYNFPFCFVLPSGLPSSFKYKFRKHMEDCFAMTTYEVSASLENQMETSMNYTIPMSVNQPMQLSDGSKKMEMDTEVTHCCCIGKGRAKIVSYFEKQGYIPGETAYLITEADNTKSTAAIENISGEFYQVIKMKAGFYEDTVRNSLKNVSTQGLQPGESKQGPNAIRIEIPLVNDKHTTNVEEKVVQPTSRGKLITNEYYISNVLNMDACICCGSHPTCTLQLSLRNPSYNYNPWQSQPENWNPQTFSTMNFQFNADNKFDTNMYVNTQASSPQYSGHAQLQFPVMPGMPQMPPPPS